MSLVTSVIAKQKSLEWPSIIDSFQRIALDPDGPFRAFKSLYKTHLCINESANGQRVAGVKWKMHIRYMESVNSQTIANILFYGKQKKIFGKWI